MQTIFMFSGQGSQYYQMGRDLFEASDDFRQILTSLDHQAQDFLDGASVLEFIYDRSRTKTDCFDNIHFSSQAIFITEIAISRLLIRMEIAPDQVLGASMGTLAAATVAGCLDPVSSMEILALQGALFERHCTTGGMIAILGSPDLRASLACLRESEIAGVIFPSHFVVAAKETMLATIEAGLDDAGVTHQKLPVTFPFHSHWMDSVAPAFRQAIERFTFRRPVLPLVCCARAHAIDDISESFLWEAVRNPIRFMDTIMALERSGPLHYLDVGPSGTLATFVKYVLPSHSRSKVSSILTPYETSLSNLEKLRR